MLAMIWRDMLFAVAWLLAASIVLVMADRGRGARIGAALVALALIGFGVLLRPTSFVAAPLLIGYALWPMYHLRGQRLPKNLAVHHRDAEL